MDKTAKKRKNEVPEPSGSTGKRPARQQHYLASYSKDFPCIAPSKLGPTYARCNVCDIDFVVTHGGASDVSAHVKTLGHKKKGVAIEQSSKLTTFFTSKTPSAGESSVIRAETLFTHFLVEHNIALSAADHAGRLFREMFADSKIAQAYSSGRTKTTEIVKACGKEISTQLAEDMRNGPFVLGTDGSQEGAEKYFPIVVTVERGFKHHTELLSIPTCDGPATGEAIFTILDKELKEYNIEWSNCLSLVVDNANVMTGRHKGVIAYVQGKVKKVHLAGCVCHLLHLAVKKGIKASSKFDLDETLRQINWYFEKSTCRQQRFQALQQKYKVPDHKLLHHVPTRWLSMGAALCRTLEQWEPLQCFFKEECQTKKDSSQASTVKMQLKDFFRRRTPQKQLYYEKKAMAL
eukprot:TRINITY_DN57899_c0_g1_i1.p1 TRINITY_DN57899_c0_g1~~TRINITY_DN57899_c0_g1_i1.p1  ORF type:complete len:405 (+),score=95.04 TRINITY_DN57899_c0_g1_i1:479-1693(+)